MGFRGRSNVGPGGEMDECGDDLSSDYPEEDPDSEPPEQEEEVYYRGDEPGVSPVSQPRRRASPQRVLAKAARKSKVKKRPPRRAKPKKEKAEKKPTVKRPAEEAKKKAAPKRSQ